MCEHCWRSTMFTVALFPLLGQHVQESRAGSSMDTLGAGMVVRLGQDCSCNKTK